MGRKNQLAFPGIIHEGTEELTSQLKSQKRYAELLEDCELVLKRYPSEEWQCMKLESLNDMKRYREAVEYYEALETEARQTCTPFLSQDLKEQYLKAKNMMQYEVVEMEQIQKELMPVLLKPGATSCEYLEFVDIYQFMMRVFARERISSQLLLLTLAGRRELSWNPLGCWKMPVPAWKVRSGKRSAALICTHAMAATSFWYSWQAPGSRAVKKPGSVFWNAIVRSAGIRRSHCAVNCAISVRMSCNVAHEYCHAVINP